jgi:large subunit ribosomal protein L15
MKYGYILPDITKDELFRMLSTWKDPRQSFFGLAPGQMVNMADNKILKCTDENLKYHSSLTPFH